MCVRLSGIAKGGATENSTTADSTSQPLLEVSDASTRGATCDALVHSSLLTSGALKAGEGALVRAIGGRLRMSGVVAWRPTGTKTREEEEEAEEGDENDGSEARKNKKASNNGFVRPFLLPTPAVLLVAPDLPRGAILAGRGDGAPAALVPISAVAASSSSSSNSTSSSSAVVAAGVVVSVGPLERDFGTAAAARAASGVARVVWLSDDFEKERVGTGPNPPSTPPPTPLLLLDALAAAGDALSPGEVLLLPGATLVPLPPGSTAGSAPCALEARPGALLVVVPCSSPSSNDDDGEGLTTMTAAARSLLSRKGESLRPKFTSLSPGVTRVALAGTLVSSSLVVSRGAGAGGKARQQTLVGGADLATSNGGRGKERDLVLLLDDGSGATVELRLPSASAPRSAWAAREGEVVIATAARASVERKENEIGEGTTKVSCVVVTASRCAFQSLPRLPALLASPSLAFPGLVTLKSALEQLLLLSSKESKEEGKGNKNVCALVDAVVAATPAVAVRRAHSSCGRPLRRSALDPSAMAEMMMMMDEDGEGEEGEEDFDVSEKKSEPAAAVAVAAPAAAAAPVPPPTATAGSLVLSVPAPTPGPATKGGGGGGGGSTGKKNKRQQPPATPAANAAAEAAADDAGFLWSCDFCGVDCSASGVTLSLELELKLTGGEEGASATARAEGAAAASLLGCVPSEFVAWAPRARAAKAAALEGRRVRVALVSTAGNNSIVDVVGVMVLDDEEEEDGEEGSGSDGEVM